VLCEVIGEEEFPIGWKGQIATIATIAAVQCLSKCQDFRHGTKASNTWDGRGSPSLPLPQTEARAICHLNINTSSSGSY
jgi:hypothetical protein